MVTNCIFRKCVVQCYIRTRQFDKFKAASQRTRAYAAQMASSDGRLGDDDQSPRASQQRYRGPPRYRSQVYNGYQQQFSDNPQVSVAVPQFNGYRAPNQYYAGNPRFGGYQQRRGYQQWNGGNQQQLQLHDAQQQHRFQQPRYAYQQHHNNVQQYAGYREGGYQAGGYGGHGDYHQSSRDRQQFGRGLPIRNCRKFEYVGEKPSRGSRGRGRGRDSQYYMDIRVISYNVLSDFLMQEHPELYRDCHPDILPFDKRKNKIISSILFHDPTIICLQEVDEAYFKEFYLSELAQHGYDGHFIKRTDPSQFEGVAIFYKTDELKLLECQEVSFYVDGDHILNRGNVGMALALQPLNYKQKKLPRRICVGNTHLLYNTKRGDVKLAQLTYLLAHLHKLAQKPGEPDGTYYPTFLCGDFNSVPLCPLYKFVTTGRIRYDTLDKKMISGQTDYSQSYIERIAYNLLPPFLTHASKFAVNGNGDAYPVTPSLVNETRKSVKKQYKPSTQKVKQLCLSSRQNSLDQDSSKVVNYLAFPDSRESKLTKVDEGQPHLGIGTYLQPDNLLSENEGSRPRAVSLSELVTDGRDQPVGMSGDSQPSGAVTPTPSQPILSEETKWGELTHNFKFFSAYRHDRISRHLPRLVPEATTKDCNTVDYIFYTPDACSNTSEVRKKRESSSTGSNKCCLTLLSRYGLLSSSEIISAGGLPNSTEPSDHLPIAAEFRLKGC